VGSRFDINLTYSDIAREYDREGLPADRIIKLIPMYEVFQYYQTLNASDVLEKLNLEEK
jgi:hypothetical protein